MNSRRLGRTGFDVSEIGCGLGGLWEGWDGWNAPSVADALTAAVELGCNFFDTALSYGNGYSESVLRDIVLSGTSPETRIYVASKVSAKNDVLPTTRESVLKEVFPRDHIRASTESSLRNLGVDCIDLMQFHTWEDSWAHDDSWKEEVAALKREGLVRAWGISVNRWEPWNVLTTLESGLIDAIQVCYNIFDQSPADELLPACADFDIGVIARSPFDEGMLTGSISSHTRWPEGDWRNTYFTKQVISESIPRVERVASLAPSGMPIAELSLRFILGHPAVDTVIPGMRTVEHVRSNCAVSDGEELGDAVRQSLAEERWDRVVPTGPRDRGVRSGL